MVRRGPELWSLVLPGRVLATGGNVQRGLGGGSQGSQADSCDPGTWVFSSPIKLCPDSTRSRPSCRALNQSMTLEVFLSQISFILAVCWMR